MEKRIVMVTGSGMGIGLACAEAFAREGATVIMADIQKPEEQARKLIDAGTGNEIDGLVINSELSQNCTLYVPKGSGQAYRNSDSWRNFKNIVEIDFAGLNSVETT